MTTSGTAPQADVHSPGRLAYVPALDGLRAIAVLAVMLYHGGVLTFRGGFLGVDLFFVLSGYLITTLMLREIHSTGHLGLRDFYVRRIRRLFPALLIFVLGVAVFCRTEANQFLVPVIRDDVLAALEYRANWRFISSHQSYFATFIVPSPVRHVWSLAVEEQWYLVWPVVLMGLLKLTRRRLEVVLAVVLGLAAVSAAWMAHLVQPLSDPSRAYYGSDTRAHTLLIGAALALALHRWPITTQRARRLWQILGASALVAAVAAFFTINGFDHWMYQGGYLAFAVVCALVINGVMASTDGPLARVLSAGPLPWIGRISYGLYLWHWLIDVWLTPQFTGNSFTVTLIERFVAAFAVSTVSYYAFERPIRTAHWERIRWPRLATVALLVILFFAVRGVALWSTQVQTVAAASIKRPPPVKPAPSLPSDMTVLVVGDSVGWSIAYNVPKLPGLRLVDAAIIGCGVLPGDLYEDGVETKQVGTPPCSTAPKHLQQGLAAHPDVVVLTWGAWEVYDHIIDGRHLPFYGAEYRRRLSAKLESELDTIMAHTDVPIVVLDAPCMHQDDFWLGSPSSPRNDRKRVAYVNDVLHHVAEQRPGRVTVVDWAAWLCPGGKFLERRDGVVLRPDGVHLDQGTSTPLLWKWLRPQLESIVRASK